MATRLLISQVEVGLTAFRLANGGDREALSLHDVYYMVPGGGEPTTYQRVEPTKPGWFRPTADEAFTLVNHPNLEVETVGTVLSRDIG